MEVRTKACLQIHQSKQKTGQIDAPLEDLQSRPNLTSWIEGEVGKLGEKKENHLHPRSTHLIFFEDAGFSRGGGQQVSNRPPLVNVFPRPLLIGLKCPFSTTGSVELCGRVQEGARGGSGRCRGPAHHERHEILTEI